MSEQGKRAAPAPHWDVIEQIPEAWSEFRLFEPRWHGWARWEYAFFLPISAQMAARDVIAHGWTRRPRGSRCVTINTRLKDAADA